MLAGFEAQCRSFQEQDVRLCCDTPGQEFPDLDEQEFLIADEAEVGADLQRNARVVGVRGVWCGECLPQQAVRRRLEQIVTGPGVDGDVLESGVGGEPLGQRSFRNASFAIDKNRLPLPTRRVARRSRSNSCSLHPRQVARSRRLCLRVVAH